MFDNEKSLKIATESLDRVQYQIRGADEKIRALFGANTLLAAALALTSQSSTADYSILGKAVIFTISALMLIATISSVIVALFALMPRLKTSGKRSLFFFGDIASLPIDNYKNKFCNLNHDTALEQIITQTHDSSRIACAKFKLMWWAGFLLIIALLLWFIIVVSRLFLAMTF